MLGFISESDNEKGGGGSRQGIRASSPEERARRHPCKPWVGFCLEEILFPPQRGLVTNRKTAIRGNLGSQPHGSYRTPGKDASRCVGQAESAC